METVLWGTVVKSLRSLQTFWQIRFFSSNPADYHWTGLPAGSAFVVLRSFFCIDLFFFAVVVVVSAGNTGLHQISQARGEERGGQSATKPQELRRLQGGTTRMPGFRDAL